VSLTLSPALCAILFKPHQAHATPSPLTKPFVAFFNGFNRGFDWLASFYGRTTARLVRLTAVVLAVYAGLLALTGWQFGRAPTGFIPQQDQGYLITVFQLPPGASLARTDEVIRRAAKEIMQVPGVESLAAFAGFEGATFTNASNAGAIFVVEKSFEERAKTGMTQERIQAELTRRLGAFQEAFVIVIRPPSVRGIGTAGGFKMMVQDQRGRGPEALAAAVQNLIQAASRSPDVTGMFSLFNTRTPKIYADIDRVQSKILGVPASRVFETLEI
jgi:HAE1 family hydrophobic/amphiphilic exporter-1